MSKLRSFDIPQDMLMPPVVSFQDIVDTIAHAPRPVSLAEVAYNLTGNPHYQHYLNPKFSGDNNKNKREEAGLVISHKEGRTSFWEVIPKSDK